MVLLQGFLFYFLEILCFNGKVCVCTVCEMLIVWNIHHTSHTLLPLFTYTVLSNLFQEKKKGVHLSCIFL